MNESSAKCGARNIFTTLVITISSIMTVITVVIKMMTQRPGIHTRHLSPCHQSHFQRFQLSRGVGESF